MRICWQLTKVQNLQICILQYNIKFCDYSTIKLMIGFRQHLVKITERLWSGLILFFSDHTQASGVKLRSSVRRSCRLYTHHPSQLPPCGLLSVNKCSASFIKNYASEQNHNRIVCHKNVIKFSVHLHRNVIWDEIKGHHASLICSYFVRVYVKQGESKENLHPVVQEKDILHAVFNCSNYL